MTSFNISSFIKIQSPLRQINIPHFSQFLVDGTCPQAGVFLKKYQESHICLKCTGCESKTATTEDICKNGSYALIWMLLKLLKAGHFKLLVIWLTYKRIFFGRPIYSVRFVPLVDYRYNKYLLSSDLKIIFTVTSFTILSWSFFF